MTPRIVGFLSALALCIAGLAWVSVSGQVFVGTPSPPQFAAQGQPSTKNGEWPHYNGDLRGSRYSPLDQISAANFSKLQVAWRSRPTRSDRFPSTSSRARR